MFYILIINRKDKQTLIIKVAFSVFKSSKLTWYTNDMKKISVFVGTSGDVYVFTITDGKRAFQLEPMISQYEAPHRMLLKGLITIMEASKNVELIFYSNDNHLAFEWEREYKQDNQFSKGTKDIEQWNKVIELKKKNKIDLKVKGEEDVLFAIGKRLSKEVARNGS